MGDALFSKRSPILSLWQAEAEQFLPIRADFTWTRSIGMEFASHLMTGFPALCQRDLANSLSAMLRPRGKPWFHPQTMFEKTNKDQECALFLDYMGGAMRMAMYDNQSGFVRATKEGDNDFAAFGQTVISVEPNQNLDGILYRCWHLRDVVWAENANLEIDQVHRRWNPSARGLMKLFPKTVHAKVKEAAEKDAIATVQVRHIVIPADEYDAVNMADPEAAAARANGMIPRKKLPFVSIFVDVDNQVILEEVGQSQMGYVIPRWQTISGSQYAYSPASVIAIADARMLQQISLTLLEAGQKAVDPPLKAVESAVQGGVNYAAGQVTWVDMEYDERTGAAIEPLLKTNPNLGWGVDREDKIRELIKEAFFLNQISLPDPGKEMTAYETQKRVEEYTRRALPLFEPMEVEYNGAICQRTLDMMLAFGAFGPSRNIPKKLQGQQIRFTFESPLQNQQGRANAEAFTQAAQLLQLAVQIDPTTVHDFKADTAFRDAVMGTGAPTAWLATEKEAAAAKAMAVQRAAAQSQVQNTLNTASQGADVAGKIGAAATQLTQGGLLAPPQQQQGGLI